MPPCLKAQTLAHFLEGRLHLPASNKPRDDLLRLGGEIGAKECLGLELFLRVSDQHPAQRYGGQAGGVPDCRLGDDLYSTLLFATPVCNHDRLPAGRGVFSDNGEVGQTLSLESGPSYLSAMAWRGWFVEGSIQAQAGDEGDRLGESAAAIEELQRGISAIGDGYYLAFWVPTPHLQKQLPGPLGKLLMSLSPLFCVAFGRGQCRKEGQGPNPRGPWARSQQRQANPPQSTRLDEVGVAGSDRVAVDPFCCDLLALTALQSLVYAYHQRPLGYECLNKQSQQEAARLPTRPDGTAQNPMVAAEPFLFVQAHRSESGGYSSLAWGEDKTCEQQLNMLPDAIGEQWREGGQDPYHRGW